MSKSKGVFFTPGQWLEIGKPETLNYFLFRSKPLKHKDFNPEMPFLDFIDQYDRVERIYYGSEEPASSKEGEKSKKIYEMSQIELNDKMPFQPSYRFMTVAYQIADGNIKKVFEILKKNSQLPEYMNNVEFENLDEKDLKNLEMRMENVKNWLNIYAPEFVKFSVMKKIPKLPLGEDQIQFLLKLADLLEEKEYTAEELHDEMYNLLTEMDMKPQKAFQAIYKIIIGKKQGPRAASFVLSLDTDFVVKRFRKEA